MLKVHTSNSVLVLEVINGGVSLFASCIKIIYTKTDVRGSKKRDLKVQNKN